MSEPIKTPISQGIIDRVVRGVKYVVTGGNPGDWFSPQQPLPPFAPKEVAGRQFDYPVGYNVNIIPRAYEAISFGQLRGLADNLDILRLVIETRKDMMCKLTFEIKPIDPKVESDDRCKAVNDFFRFPDQEHTWDEWLRMLLEDLFVIDAPTIYPRMNLGGGLYGLEPVDGATIKRVIDGSGRTPQPPEVAYQQILKGVPAIDYSRDELIYKPRNLRTNKVYGYSPVEQIIMTVNIALRRQVSQLQFYTEGDAADRIMSVPETWNPDQVRQFSEWWQSVLAGNTGARRKTMFVPNGVTSVNTKEALLKDGYDEWLSKVIAYAFGVSPQALISQMNRATAQTSVEAAKEEGLAPIMLWVKNLIDYIVWKYFGYKDLHLSWVDEKDPDPLQQAQINQIYVTTGVKMVNEVREEIGLEALTPEQEAEIAAKKAKAMQEAMGGSFGGGAPEDAGDGEGTPDPKAKMPDKNPDDDTGKLAKGAQTSKKAKRVLAPLNRQRKSITKVQKALNTFIDRKLQSLAIEAAQQLVTEVGKLNKVDAKVTAEQLLAQMELDWPELVDQVAEYLTLMAVDGVAAAMIQLSIKTKDKYLADALNLANDRARDYARERAAELVGMKWVDGDLVPNPKAEWAISESTRTMLRTDVTTAIEEGWSNDKLANAIRDNYAFSGDRAEAIARTETALADVAGNMAAYKEAEGLGVKVLKQWITAQDDLVSEDCALNGASEPIELDAMFPSGAYEPPEHPNCRCDILPVTFSNLVEGE
jgi:SPP1 gp7 family putative phage head morphogenesis protein